jgi:hypothetical protein
VSTTVPQLRRELESLRQAVSARSSKQDLQEVSAMDLKIVGRLRAIKLQEDKDGLQDRQANG